MTDQKKGRVCVIDDDPQILAALCAHLNTPTRRARGFASADAFLEALEWIDSIDCVVCDVKMPGMNGMELLAHIKNRMPDCPVIMMTGYGDVRMAVNSMQLGAVDFIEKPFDPDLLDASIAKILHTVPISLANEKARRDALRMLEKLSERERGILELVVAGLTSKEIGSALNLSFRTVEAHRAAMMSKLDAKNTADLVRLGLDAGLRNAIRHTGQT